MKAANLEDPNSDLWLGFGLIAEQYGETDAASKAYGRVEKPKVPFPATSYDLAQHHLAALNGMSTAATR
jgi:hypothetical protein